MSEWKFFTDEEKIMTINYSTPDIWAYIVFQEDPCGEDTIIGVFDNRDSAYACLDAGVMAGLMRRVEQFIVESKYDPEEDWAALNEKEDCRCAALIDEYLAPIIVKKYLVNPNK